MSKFNRPGTRVATGSGPIVAERTPSTVTHEGGAGYLRDTKSELFLLAVSNMVGEKTTYETAGDRDDRYATLVRKVAVDDPAWMLQFLRWLRTDGNMRSASLVGAAESVKARLDAKLPSIPAYEVSGFTTDRGVERTMIEVVCQRADEPGEMLAYWTSRYGRNLPKPVKRGLADAAARLYTPYALLKYDTVSHGVRFADVLELAHVTGTHPSIKGTEQGALFQAALERRHGRAEITPVPMLLANAALRKGAAEDPSVLLDAQRLREAGMTWEDVLSLAGPRFDKARLWTALIPSMGYMALLRNLRNFDESGVPDDVALGVAARLADPAEVAKSRQLPMRFLSAHKAVSSLRWGHYLEQSLNHSLGNVPTLTGRTLILVDVSGSMSWSMSDRSELNRAESAGIFASALALRAENPTMVWFNGVSGQIAVPKGGALLRVARSIPQPDGGTYTANALRCWYDGHDRVIVVTDEQYHGDNPSGAIPQSTPMYTWNLAGHRAGSTPTTANRMTFGGLTDAMFRLIPLVESGRSGVYPWQS